MLTLSNKTKLRRRIFLNIDRVTFIIHLVRVNIRKLISGSLHVHEKGQCVSIFIFVLNLKWKVG